MSVDVTHSGPERPRKPRRAPTQRAKRPGQNARAHTPLYAALDLGTNNCRLLVAARDGEGFRVVDAFSRIIRLGEGVDQAGALSAAAMDRAVGALRQCAAKIAKHSVAKQRCVATQACRAAANGPDFIRRVQRETGLRLDIIDPREEARLAVLGCLGLVDLDCEAALVVDVGGGSTELIWIDIADLRGKEGRARLTQPPIRAWASYPIGVVTLAERFPEQPDRQAWYAAMVDYASTILAPPADAEPMRGHFSINGSARAHIIGTSGAVTSLAGVHMNLPRYDRAQVDGVWISQTDAAAAGGKLLAMTRDERAAHPCIGQDRADLVLAGGAILDAVLAAWPTPRLRVADRGLREGMLMTLIHGKRRRRGRRKR